MTPPTRIARRVPSTHATLSAWRSTQRLRQPARAGQPRCRRCHQRILLHRLDPATGEIGPGLLQGLDDLSHVPKAQVIEALKEAGPDLAGGGVEAMKKEALVTTASSRLAGTRWLPEPLRRSPG